MDRSLVHRGLIVGVGALLFLLIALPACSEDPILGPNDGEDSGGGSYSSINRLAPNATTAESSTSADPSTQGSAAVNPERF